MTVSHPFPDIINRQNHNPSPVVEADDDDDDTDRITNNNTTTDNNNNDFVVVSEEPVMGLAMDHDILDNNQTSCLRRRRKTILVLGVVMFIMAIVGSLVGVLSNDSHSISPNTEEEDTNLLLQRQSKDIYYRNLQKAVVRHVYRGKYQPSVFLTPNTPQLQAMQWMAYIDTLQFPLQTLLLTTDNEAVGMKRALLQRYVLMTLLFSNRGAVLVDASVEEGTGSTITYDLDRFTNNNSTSLGEKNTTVWTPEQGIGLDECEWAFVECDGQGRVTTLQLAEYYIKDSLPREIGLLHRLKHLDLSDNSWQGPLPNELYDLTHLGMSRAVTTLLCMLGCICCIYLLAYRQRTNESIISPLFFLRYLNVLQYQKHSTCPSTNLEGPSPRTLVASRSSRTWLLPLIPLRARCRRHSKHSPI